MKKSRVILALALAVVFIITCMNVPTFSWFTRPKSQAGEDFVLKSKNEYTAYNGKNVTISTTKSTDGGVNYDTTTANYSGTNINPHTRNYFCTTITNNSGKDQNVSLYASKLSIPTTTTNGTLALGVNGPTRNYRDYTALAKGSLKTTGDVMRVYFENNYDVEGWQDKDKWYYICWNDDPDTNSPSLDGTGSNGNYYQMTKIDSNHYYADIPKTATHAFFAVQDWGTNDNGNPKWSQRSQTLWNLASDGLSQTKSVVFKITSDYDNGNHVVKVCSGADFIGACINSYYSTISVPMNSTFNAALSSGEYIGKLNYYSGDKSIFDVNETTGVITPKAAGEAILYTKATGTSYGDFVEVQTIVKVTAGSNYEFNDVPIVRNILIPSDKGDDENNPKNEVKVYWYVINNSNSNALTYTIDDIYLGL